MLLKEAIVDKELLQRKAQMVLYSIEKELGEYIKKTNNIENISGQLIKVICEREESYGRVCCKTDLAKLVSASYLSEVIDMAVQTSSSTANEQLLADLRELITKLGIITIRNTIAHPNKDFSINEWYTIACVASNNKFEQLGLSKIKETLLSAESGVLSDPPTEWLELSSIEIVNNLPSIFEHDITGGLVGRQAEVKTLSKSIFNNRINTVAVVAPGGGVGKTALVLDLLHKISYSNSFASKFKGIVYVSLKNEELTAEGIKTFTAIDSLDELKSHLIDEFDELFGLGVQKVLKSFVMIQKR